MDVEVLIWLGTLNYIAFRAKDPELVISWLKENEYCERNIPSMNLLQVLVDNRNGITVELNYWSEKRVVA